MLLVLGEITGGDIAKLKCNHVFSSTVQGPSIIVCLAMGGYPGM